MNDIDDINENEPSPTPRPARPGSDKPPPMSPEAAKAIWLRAIKARVAELASQGDKPEPRKTPILPLEEDFIRYKFKRAITAARCRRCTQPACSRRDGPCHRITRLDDRLAELATAVAAEKEAWMARNARPGGK